MQTIAATPPQFHPLIPGSSLGSDWYAGRIPDNLEVGSNSVIDSSFCFKHYYATAPVGMRIGKNVTIWRTALSVEADGFVAIGDDCYLANAAVVCSRRIEIGARVFIAGGVTIADSDLHPIEPLNRLADTIALSPIGDRARRPWVDVKPVVIEDDVWIGYNATILKGVRIGSGAMIAAGAVVTRNVPPRSEVAGNPARVVGGVVP
jgi:acetyltransferase-like isoleucine patch superfamily enzyme